MARLRPILVLFIALFLSLSFAVPKDDMQETGYDESESLPCDHSSVVSSAQSRCIEKIREGGSGAYQHFRSSIGSCELCRSDLAVLSRRIGRSLITLDQSFRY